MLKKILYLLPTAYIILFNNYSNAKTVEYILNINHKAVNYSGKEVRGLAINNFIPGPTIKAKVGDTLRVTVNNQLDEESSIHWHGILLPNDQDGVPYINTPPIHPGKSFTYQYKVTHSGTYWYHSHSGLQEQQGVYGSMIFYPEKETEKYDEEQVIVLSDWTDEHPEQVLANIKKDPDYYALKKDSVQSWDKVLSNGYKAFDLRVKNAVTRMGPMDMSDVGYDAFLINGKKSLDLSKAKPGSKIRLRIINAAASSYFILEYSGSTMKVIEADGMKVKPFTAQRIRIAMAETYDVIVTVPDNKTYEFRATSEDGTGYATARIGSGKLVAAPTIPKPNLVLMDMDMSGMHDMSSMGESSSSEKGHDMTSMNSNTPPQKHDQHQANDTPKVAKKMDDMINMDHSKPQQASAHEIHNMQAMDKMEYKGHKEGKPKVAPQLPHIAYLDNYKALKSLSDSTLPKNNPTREITLNLTGSMERYVWTINDTPMYAADKFLIKKGENVKMRLVNKTMMHHPIHLHGHFFRVLNGQGKVSPLKHTVNVAPYETTTIEFYANEEKDWIFHCHNLYHMKLGMGGIVSYSENEQNKSSSNHSRNHSKDHGNKWFVVNRLEGFSNLASFSNKFTRNNDNLLFDIEHNYDKDYEAEIKYQRFTSQFFGAYVGGSFSKEAGETTNKAIIGFEYTLPLLIKSDLRLDSKGKLRFGLTNEHQLTNRTDFDWKWNSNNEYRLGLNYSITKKLYISGNYDSKEKFGIGLSIKF
ncbi:MAG: multicopper oxidase domain-containing protein [Sphingobacteriia bacterium]|nr:multicopper oxidase domain-containing protein [Sphingobacteriia bacterium]